MAVVLEGLSVIVRNATLTAKYPGGLEGFKRDCPNQTFCSDESLSRVSFMVPSDAEIFVAQLAAKGLTPYRKEAVIDVALVGQVDGLLRPCDWLEVGHWGKTAITWLAGTKPGDVHAPANWYAKEPLQFMTDEEIKQRLEYIRSQDQMEVYRDRTTGKELYVARTATVSDQDWSRHSKLYEEGIRLIESLIKADNQASGTPTWRERRRLKKAIPLFMEVVRINPQNWSAMWLLGKIYQRFGDCEQSFTWFSQAHRINPDQPGVAREASIAAMELGRLQEALVFCQRGIEAQPGDAGLLSNFALALLFSERPSEARAVIQDSLAHDPADKISTYIAQIIEEVLSGARPCPHHARDLQ